MKPTLKLGLKHSFSYKVPENKTVPHTYPESPIIAAMPKVFATGFMIVLMEWTCTQLLNEHLDKGEGSLGTHVDVSHLAATPPGMTSHGRCGGSGSPRGVRSCSRSARMTGWI